MSSTRWQPDQKELTLTRGARTGNLKSLFAGLRNPTPSQGRVYETARIARDSRYRVGRDYQGNPVILIETTDQAATAALSDFEGRHLSVGHGVRCSISEGGVHLARAQFSVMRCVNSDDILKDRFFEMVETVLRVLGETPTIEGLRTVATGLIELFRLATQPPRGTVQGLWAELWIISHANDPGILLDAWHAEPTDVFDFTTGPQRLEVKSSKRRGRKHMFTHEQLTPLTRTSVIICSLFVESAGNGPTISGLVERIRHRVSDPRVLRKLDVIVASTLGSDWRTAVDTTFDDELASESLRFYKAEDVPSLPHTTPPGVSEVRYTSDLSRTPALTREEMRGMGHLFAASSPVGI